MRFLYCSALSLLLFGCGSSAEISSWARPPVGEIFRVKVGQPMVRWEGPFDNRFEILYLGRDSLGVLVGYRAEMLLKGDLETYKKGSWYPLTGASVDKYFPVTSNVTHIRFKGYDIMIDEFLSDEIVVYVYKAQL